MNEGFRCVVHGSFSKHFEEIREACEVFKKAGIEVLAPKVGELINSKDSFGLFEDEKGQDPRLVELLYLHNLKQLGENGFSYFISPGGYIGKSASYELGIIQLTNVRCFFSHKLTDHPAYIQGRSITSPKALADFITEFGRLPLPYIKRDEKQIHSIWESLIVPGSVVAAGAIIELQPKHSKQTKEILLVKTHKWGNRYSIVGGKVRRNEKLYETLLREVREETKLTGLIGRHICTFDQFKNSGYYKKGIQHIFVDNVVKVKNKKVTLNEEAQEYLWAPANEALVHLDIEPNARETIEIYSKQANAIA